MMVHRNSQSLDEIKLRLEAVLGIRVPQKLWEHLVAKGMAEQVRRSQKDINWLSTEVLDMLDATGQMDKFFKSKLPRMMQEQPSSRMIKREEALSVIFSRVAVEDRDVLSFREHILNGRLLKIEEIETWVQKQSRVDGPPTMWLSEIPVPQGHEIQFLFDTQSYCTEPGLTLSPENGAKQLRTQVLTYGVLHAGRALSVRRLATARNGVLEKLRQLCVRLGKEYGWDEGQASLFVLSGAIPLVSAVRIDVKTSSPVLPFSRITLELDPALTPQQVADYYQRARRNVMSGRVRSLSVKHLTLAKFAAERPAAEQWKHTMQKWNRDYPKWKYKQENNFRRDCLQATKRLLAPTAAAWRMAGKFPGILDMTASIKRKEPSKKKGE